jgi:hypothetical protein
MNIAKNLRYFALWSGWRQPSLKDLDDHNLEKIIPDPIWAPIYYGMTAGFINDGLKVGNKNFESLRFYTASLIPKRLNNFVNPQDKIPEWSRIWGIWLKTDNAIVFQRDIFNSDKRLILVRHELTHAIRDKGGHEPEYFNRTFNNVF